MISEIQTILWFITAFTVITFLVFALALRENILFSLLKAVPWRSRRGVRPPTSKPFAVWGIFGFLALASIAGIVLIAAGFGQEPDAPVQAFIPPPTRVPTATTQVTVQEQAPVRITLGFPPDVSPCTSDLMTVIPEDIDPYNLPVIYPIDEWFANHQFVRDTYTEIRITNQIPGTEIIVSDKVILEIVRFEALPRAVPAAFSVCDMTTQVNYPNLQIRPSTGLFAVKAADNETPLRTGQSSRRSITISGMEPGLYEVRLGIEYLEGVELKQVWSEETIFVQTPETIQRWSAGVITYWGECDFISGSYRCEELVLEEPILVEDQEDSGVELTETGSTEPTQVCRIAPDNRLEVGESAQISMRLGLRLRIREEPGLEGGIITSVQRGTPVNVTGGPVCKDNYWWWQVEIAGPGLSGWMAEGEPSVYYLDPTN